MTLSKQARSELDYRTREQERALNDVWRGYYDNLLLKHGACVNGLKCTRLPGLIHLSHDPIASQLIEDEFLTALRSWLREAKVIVNHIS